MADHVHDESLDLQGGPPNPVQVGPFLVLLSASAFACLGVIAKLGYRAGVTPEALLLLRFAVAAALLWLLLLLVPRLREPLQAPADGKSAFRRRHALPRGRSGVLWTALGLGAVGYATQAAFYFAALERIDAALVALVLYTYPALVTLAAALLGREPLTPRRLLALTVSACGTLLVLLGGGSGVNLDMIGVALAFGGAVTYTVYILISDGVVHRLPPFVLAAWVMTGAAVSLALKALLSGGVDLSLSPAGWSAVAGVAVVSTVVAMGAFFAGLSRTGPSTAAILSTVEPVVTTALAAVALGEFLAPLQLLGGAVVLTSVLILQAKSRTRVAPASTADHVVAQDELRPALRTA